MKFRYSRLILFLLFCVSKAAFGQITTAPGYIINSAGDSVSGQLEYVNTNLSAKRAFISNTSGKLEFLKPEQLQSLYINPEIHFKTLPFKGKKVFMQVVVEGQLDLYEYKSNLFVLSNTDSLIMLTGGKKTVEKDGKKYAIYDYTYKSQLRSALPTDAYNQKIDRLKFKDKDISQLVRDINQMQEINSENKISKRHQFSGHLGIARASFNIRKRNYQGGDLHSKQALFETDVYFEKERLTTLIAGGYYRWKVGKKYAYLKTGLVYEKAISRTETQKKNLYRSFLIDGSKDEPYDQRGYMDDSYKYNFAAISIPLSYYGELSDGRLRPFLDLGLNTRIYTNREFSLNRKVFLEDVMASEENSKLYIKPFTIGPIFSAGGRYLFRNNTSVVAGLHFDAVLSKNIVDPSDFKTNTTMLYISYGF